MKRQIRINAPAKINLGLDVLGRRDDGYHELRMVMATVRVFDRITLTVTAAPGIRIQTNRGFLPTDSHNLAWRAAAMLMEEAGVEEGLFIDLEKKIPVAAGLAGGSSDAAAVLEGVNRLFDLGLDREALSARGARIGADVPYCLMKGTALAEGFGEILTPLPALPPCFIVLAKPRAHISTAQVFGSLDRMTGWEHPDIDGQMAALAEGDLEGVARHMGNVLELVTAPICPAVGEFREIMLGRGALGAMMSGSGPTVFGIFADEESARAACTALREHSQAAEVFLTAPYEPAGRTGEGKE